MEDNQENDVKSCFDSSLGEGKLLIKLKIPKDEEQQNKTEFSQNRDIDNKMKNKTLVCDICNKVFTSGKALGGHKSFHVQQAKNKDRISKKKQILPRDEEEEEIDESYFGKNRGSDGNYTDVEKSTCVVCGQNFPSMKSLSGHMRFHPERNWRGLQPPRRSMVKKSSSSSSSSSALLDAETQQVEDTGTVDLKGSLTGWSVTSRRGRKSITTSKISQSELDAANDLMMLASGDPKAKVLDIDPIKGKMEHLEIEEKGSNEIGKALVLGESINKSKVNEDHECSYFSKDDEQLKVLIKNKKKRKKVKLCDLETLPQNDASANEKSVLTRSDKYCCDTCGKSFPSPQALGGHRSSHKKFKITIQNSIEEAENNLPSSRIESPGEGSRTCRRELDFDLNEMPPTKDEAAGFDQLLLNRVN